VKTKFKSLLLGIIALSLFAIAPKAASAQQAASQEGAPPPPQSAFAAPPAPSPNGPPPPPPRRGLRPAPPPACGPDAPPPPRPEFYPQAAASSVRGSIKQFNYGPEGEVSGFVLANGTQVNFPPELGEQITALAKLKSEVSVVGYQRQTVAGKTIFDAVTITANAQTLSTTPTPGPRTAPPPPPPPPATGERPEPPQN
jgi:hypothetical protein